MAILDGEEYASKSFMNIARTSFASSGKDFNYLFSPKQYIMWKCKGVMSP
jgi:hypothetical protein